MICPHDADWIHGAAAAAKDVGMALLWLPDRNTFHVVPYQPPVIPWTGIDWASPPR